MRIRRILRLLAATVALISLFGSQIAYAEFPYPSPPAGTDPYDYGAYMKSSTEPSDMGEGERWKYGSKTACDYYQPPAPKSFYCDPVVNANPQELHGVTGASVDKAWATTTGRPDVIIAVHDSGIKWDDRGAMFNLNTKTWINHGELPTPGTTTFGQDRRAHDTNNDGVFNIVDYCADWKNPANCTGISDHNKTGYIDPEDLIFQFSNGVDDDGNGYADDIAGWDSYEDDNDPYDEVQYGHGTGEAIDSTAEANNGQGGVGTCPNCLVMHMRVGDSFIGDVNDFAQGVVYATDNGASVIQSALGTLNNSRFAQEAINYAYRRGVVLIASAADESAGHHNQPSVLEHAVTMNSSGEPEFLEEPAPQRPPSYMEFRGCTNYGAYISATVPSNSCSSEAVGRSAGMAALAYSAARNAVTAGTIADYGALDGAGGVPDGRGLSAEEIDQLIVTTADDYNFTQAPYTDRVGFPEPTKRYGATPGWDPFFGYGRINTRRMVKAVEADLIPPEADITSPKWFEIVDPDDGPVEIDGFVASRRTAKYSYTVEWAPWSWRGPERNAYRTPQYSSTGVTLRAPGDQSQPVSGRLATIDPTSIQAALLTQNGPVGTDDGPAINPATGRGDHENEHWPDKFGIIVRVTVTAKDQLGLPVRTPYDAPEGGGNPNNDAAVTPATGPPLIGVGTKNFNFHDDPALFPGFPKDLQGDGAAAPRFADLNDDGRDELIVATSNGLVHAYKNDGTELPGWPVHTTDSAQHYSAPAFRSGEITTPVYAASLRSPAVGDIDRDGDLEVLVPDFQGRVTAFDKKGNRLWAVRADPAFSTPQRPDREAGFYATQRPDLVKPHPEGRPQIDITVNNPDWVPDIVNRHTKLNRLIWWVLATPTLGNLDSDDQLEMLMGAGDRHMYAFNHDGTPMPGWPVLMRDPATVGSVDPKTHEVTNAEGIPNDPGAKVIVSPALGDLDNDTRLDIVAAVNEQYGGNPNSDDPVFGNPLISAFVGSGNNRLYRLHRAGTGGAGTRSNVHPHAQAYFDAEATPERDWPASIATLLVDLLPVVGSGPDGSPVLANVNSNQALEIGIFGTTGPGYVLNPRGDSIFGKDQQGRDRTLLTQGSGPGSNSPENTSIPAVGGAIFTRAGPGPYTFVAPAAGAGKILDLLLNDDQLLSDNHLSVWDLTDPNPDDNAPGPRQQVPAFPREVNDLQFLTTPASADIDGDGRQEILEGTAYSDLHAFSITGEEPGMRTLAPTAWPKFTGGWSVAPPAVGDFDDDRLRDVAHTIREGSLFVWKGNGAEVCDPATWPEFGHDGWMTNNVETDAVRPRVITNLVGSAPGNDTRLVWTAPGDDGVCRQAHSYEIRRSDQPLTNENFEHAELIERKAAGAPDSEETLVIQGACGTNYYAVRTWDADPATDTPAHPANPSAVSNSVSITSNAPGCTTPTPRATPSVTPTPTGTLSTPTTPPTGRGRATTTIASDKDKVGFRKPFVLSGQVTGTAGCSAPYEISLERRIHGRDDIKTIRPEFSTRPNGSWQLRMRSRVNADYFAQVASTGNCEGSRSAPEDVSVRAKVKIGFRTCNGRVVSLWGSVRMPHPGTRVLLQKRTDGGWKRVDRDRLNKRSKFFLRTRRCGATYRVVWPQQSQRNLRGSARV